ISFMDDATLIETNADGIKKKAEAMKQQLEKMVMTFNTTKLELYARQVSIPSILTIDISGAQVKVCSADEPFRILGL
ncbi:hypothetical protein OFC51_36245, partial [Escherichia coli]|nr:hypothetical protein [Escherichia coli]